MLIVYITAKINPEALAGGCRRWKRLSPEVAEGGNGGRRRSLEVEAVVAGGRGGGGRRSPEVETVVAGGGGAHGAQQVGNNSDSKLRAYEAIWKIGEHFIRKLRN
ncbi:Uncharacterized protein Fot_21039 [Forsythia ovata]|uniref:Uncharacterized protein n=1 Tax=Forsythia ovata TaxID=205694 RepID=A0ABD1UVJ8_9LAMI